MSIDIFAAVPENPETVQRGATLMRTFINEVKGAGLGSPRAEVTLLLTAALILGREYAVPLDDLAAYALKAIEKVRGERNDDGLLIADSHESATHRHAVAVMRALGNVVNAFNDAGPRVTITALAGILAQFGYYHRVKLPTLISQIELMWKSAENDKLPQKPLRASQTAH
jgi:hypothetical protein